MNGNGGGFINGIKPEEETRRVDTSALWEDVLRPLSQAVAYGLSIIWQIITVLAALTSWAMAWAESNRADPMVGDMPNLIAALIWFASFFVVGVIVSHERIQWLIGRPAGYDETTLSNGVTLIIVIVAWSILNALFNHTIVFVLMTTRVIPIMATVIAVGSWFACSPLREGLREDMRANARNNSSQWHIARENNRHALEVLELQHDLELDKGPDVTGLEAQLSIAQQTAEALTIENDQLRSRPEDMRIVPANHGSARLIGDRQFTSVEVEALTRYINGWAERGTGAIAWTTKDGRQKWNGTGISDPQWRKFTAMLKALGYMDSSNRPTLDAETILERFKLTTPPPQTETGLVVSDSLEEPKQTKPNQALDEAIHNLPKRTKTS